jgi:hypothetical protein
VRPRLVRHSGKKRLTVTVPGPMPTDAASWTDATARFAKLLADEIDDADLFACDFSTSTEVERTVGRIVLLDAYSPYFALWMVCICGIPSITLTGTVEDWRRIRARVDAVAGFGLERWCRSLAPITDEFVRAASGDADPRFWERIYNPVDAYGGDHITGWIARFYPYLTGSTTDVPNGLLDLPIGEPRDVPTAPGHFYEGPGITSDLVPATLSRVIVNVNDQVAGGNGAVALHGGLVGIAQDPDGALRPVAGWYLAPAARDIHDAIERLVREHDTEPPQGHLPEGSAEVVALYSRVGGATLFGGGWRLVKADESRYVRCDANVLRGDRVFALSDGRSLVAATDGVAGVTYWLLCRLTMEGKAPYWRMADGPADIPVLGTSLAMILDAALDSGGDVAHLETGRLDQLVLSD